MIVDLLIAAETLFFSDITRADRGEFRFRLSSRVALLLGETPDERRRLAKFMRHAYDARSGVVHGGDPGAENLRALEGTQRPGERISPDARLIIEAAEAVGSPSPSGRRCRLVAERRHRLAPFEHPLGSCAGFWCFARTGLRTGVEGADVSTFGGDTAAKGGLRFNVSRR